MKESPQPGVKWIIKSEEGLVRGPFSTKDVLKMIESMELTGDEFVARYPGGEWYEISRENSFYDKLLEALSANWSTPVAENTYDEKDDSEEIDKSQTPVQPSTYTKNSESKITKKIEVDEVSISDDADHKLISEEPEHSTQSEFVSKKIEDLELVDTLPEKKKIFLHKFLKITAGLFIFFLVVLLLLPSPKKARRSVSGISLMEPLWTDQVSDEVSTELSLKIKRAQALFFTSTLDNILKAQNELVQVLELNEKAIEAYQYLCLIYFELWTYTDQSSEQKRIFSSVLKKSGQNDFAGLSSTTCRIVDLFLKDRLQEASFLIDATLERYSSIGDPPPMLYYFKAKSLDLRTELQTAIGYLQSAQKLQPAWLDLFIYEAELQLKKKDFSRSQNILASVLKINPSHYKASVLLGIVEEKGFRQSQKAIERLEAGLTLEKYLTPDLASTGFQTLAEIYFKQGKKKEAYLNAEKAYKKYSSNIAAKNLLIQLGGKDLASEAQFQSRQLVFEGDQYFREGEFNSAQALYKTAFEIDNSALAALKSGRSLWRLNFPTDAIEWVKKAIQADPLFLEAYITLADYYTARFDFVAAARVLSQAQKVLPNSHEVYRGFALVELRRNSPQGAITYAERALKLYEADVDSYIILAKAFLATGDYRSAYAQASKAIEVDTNSRDGHSVYARSLAGVQGYEVALDYLYNLVQSYPMISDYRMVLAELLIENESYLEAERILRQLIQLEEKPKSAHIKLGIVLANTGKLEDALDEFFKASLLDPSDGEPLFQAGLILLQAGKPGEARSQFERVFALNERYPLVNYWMGKAALAFGQVDDALKFAQAERKTNPNLADSYLLSAEIYTKREQYSLCAQEYQRAIKLGRQSAQIYVNLAICHRLLGNLDIALSMLNQASAKESGFPPLYRELGQVYERKGDFERAAESFKQYFVLDPSAPDRALIEQRLGGYN